jgi:hypothetical protein
MTQAPQVRPIIARRWLIEYIAEQEGKAVARRDQSFGMCKQFPISYNSMTSLLDMHLSSTNLSPANIWSRDLLLQ